MYAVIINQDRLHLEVCLFAIFLILKFDKGILKAVVGTFVPNDLTRYYGTETAKNCFKILVCVR